MQLTYPAPLLHYYLPFFSLLEVWSPFASSWELRACISSVGDEEQGEKQAWRLQWKFEQTVQYPFTCYCNTLCHIFLLPTWNQLRAKWGKAGVANGLLAGFNKAVILVAASSCILLHCFKSISETQHPAAVSSWLASRQDLPLHPNTMSH